MNVLLIGEESAGIQMLRALAHSGHRLVGVMASLAKKSNGGITTWQLAERMGYRTWPAKLVKDPAFAEVVCAEEVDLLLNVHSLFIIAPEIVNAPRIGSFNLHPGPLPRYAGLNAISWALSRGESAYGVTVHKIEAAIDTGPIVYQSLFSLEESETALSVWTKCIREGVPLMLRLLETASVSAEAITLVPQDLTQREYFGAQTPQLNHLFRSRPAREIINLVRACDFFPFPSPWGHPQVRLGDQVIGIVKARCTGQPCDAGLGTVGERAGMGISLACMDEWILLEKLLVAGQYVNPADALQPGVHLEEVS